MPLVCRMLTEDVPEVYRPGAGFPGKRPAYPPVFFTKQGVCFIRLVNNPGMAYLIPLYSTEGNPVRDYHDQA
jgi:hypothetical protein